MAKPLDIVQSLVVHDPWGKTVAYLVPRAEVERRRDIDWDGELRDLRAAVAGLRGELARAHQTIAELNAAQERLLKERAELEAERNEYLRAVFFLSKEESRFTEADRRASEAPGPSLSQVLEEIGRLES